MLAWLSRTALDLIGVGGLGYNFNALDGEEHDYTRGMKEFNSSIFKLSKPQRFLPYLEGVGSRKFRRAALKALSIVSDPLKQLLGCTDLMWRWVTERHLQTRR